MSEPEINEELVERISLQFCILCQYFDMAVVNCTQELWKDFGCHTAEDLAEDAIMDVLSAVHDGKQGTPGEVGRYPHTLLHRKRKMTRIESDLFDHYKAHRDEIESFIALGRKEEQDE